MNAILNSRLTLAGHTTTTEAQTWLISTTKKRLGPQPFPQRKFDRVPSCRHGVINLQKAQVVGDEWTFSTGVDFPVSPQTQ